MTGGSARILVVDDNADAAVTLCDMLELLRFHCRSVHNGEDALREVRVFRPAAVICDIAMPGMDGYAVARRVIAEHGSRRPLLIAYTGFGNTVERTKSYAAGFDHHLTKPADLQDVLVILSGVQNPGD